MWHICSSFKVNSYKRKYLVYNINSQCLRTNKHLPDIGWHWRAIRKPSHIKNNSHISFFFLFLLFFSLFWLLYVQILFQQYFYFGNCIWMWCLCGVCTITFLILIRNEPNEYSYSIKEENDHKAKERDGRGKK